MGKRDSGPLRFDPARLVTALSQIPTEAWSSPSTYRETSVHHGYRRVPLVTASKPQPHAELFQFTWDAMRPVRDVTLSWLDPDGFIIPHRDAGPWFERWQIPIQASGDGLTGPPGVAFPVAHWEPHHVTNRGPGPRIHLVVDRDVHVDRDPLPFATFPVPADMADLIERSQQ